MKIALAPDYLDEYGGAERVFESFCRIFPDAKVFTLLYNPEVMPESIRKMDIVVSPLNDKYKLRRKFGREAIVSKFPVAIEQFDFSGFDVVISSGSFAKGILTKPETTHIFYCHRLMRSLWEHHEEFIESKPKILKPYLRYLTYKLRMWDELAADRPDYIIANSKHTQTEIKKFYRKDSEVIYPPINVGDFKISEKPEDYFLLVSRIGPFDKVDLVIEAFNDLGFHLLIVGDGSERKKLSFIAKNNIEFVGFKDQEVLREYYANARGLISIGEESFGLVEVEAQASGLPIIALKKGGVEETVIPGETGEFFEELSVKGLISGVHEFIKKEKQFNRVKIKQDAQKFDESVFERKIKELVEKVGKGKK